MQSTNGFHGCIKSVSRVARLLGTVALALTFTFWGHQAIVKFISKPISTKVYFRNGDDGFGNIQFPALTICLSDYRYFQRRFQQELLDEKCYSGFNPVQFRQVTLLCYGKHQDSTTSSTTEGEGFGDLFGDPIPETPTVLFDDINHLIEETSLNASDMIFRYQLGNERELFLGTGFENEYIEQDWFTSIDEIYGKCFTFEPRRLNLSMIETIVRPEILPQFLEVEVTFQKLMENNNNHEKIMYKVYIHENIYDILDAPFKYPFYKVGAKDTLLLKISKTNISSLPSDDFMCSHEANYGQQRCIHQQVRIIESLSILTKKYRFLET